MFHFKRNRVRGLYRVVGLWLPFVLQIGCGPEGPTKYPVSGRVTVNGQPAQYVRVQFLHTDQTLPGNLKMPVGMTDAAGQYQLSTSGQNDGAVPGQYTIVLEWMSANDLGAFDKFAGKFADPATSSFRATVEPKTNELPPIEITIPDHEIVTKPRSRNRTSPSEVAP
jgi:hypothetical protein